MAGAGRERDTWQGPVGGVPVVTRGRWGGCGRRPREKRVGPGGSERSGKALMAGSRVMRSVSVVSACAAP